MARSSDIIEEHRQMLDAALQGGNAACIRDATMALGIVYFQQRALDEAALSFETQIDRILREANPNPEGTKVAPSPALAPMDYAALAIAASHLAILYQESCPPVANEYKELHHQSLLRVFSCTTSADGSSNESTKRGQPTAAALRKHEQACLCIKASTTDLIIPGVPISKLIPDLISVLDCLLNTAFSREVSLCDRALNAMLKLIPSTPLENTSFSAGRGCKLEVLNDYPFELRPSCRTLFARCCTLAESILKKATLVDVDRKCLIFSGKIAARMFLHCGSSDLDAASYIYKFRPMLVELHNATTASTVPSTSLDAAAFHHWWALVSSLESPPPTSGSSASSSGSLHQQHQLGPKRLSGGPGSVAQRSVASNIRSPSCLSTGSRGSTGSGHSERDNASSTLETATTTTATYASLSSSDEDESLRTGSLNAGPIVGVAATIVPVSTSLGRLPGPSLAPNSKPPTPCF